MESFQSGGRPIRLDSIRPSRTGPVPAILLLHGSGGNIGFWLNRFAPHLERFGIALFAAHYFDRTETVRADTDTILDGIHFPQWLDTVGDALTHIVADPSVDPDRIALIGISLGAFLSLARATVDNRIRAVVEVSGGMPESFAASATTSLPPTLILHGMADTVVPVGEARKLAALLDRLHVPHQTELFPGEGHWFTPAAQLRILLAVASFLGRHLAPASKYMSSST